MTLYYTLTEYDIANLHITKYNNNSKQKVLSPTHSETKAGAPVFILFNFDFNIPIPVLLV